jgi:hypothetical protein
MKVQKKLFAFFYQLTSLRISTCVGEVLWINKFPHDLLIRCARLLPLMEFRLTFFDCRVALEKLAAFGVETASSLLHG